MRLNKTMEDFYLNVLDYAGLELDEEENIVNKDLKTGPFTIDDRDITLPYMDSLRNPQGRAFFHLLNENYTTPETSMFLLYKRKLTHELNLRLSGLVRALIVIASDAKLQQRVKSPELLDIITSIGEADYSIIEGFMKMSTKSAKVNDEGYLLNFFLKKNGSINKVPYSATGKVNFKLYNEIEANLDKAPYTVYDVKLRKKDLSVVANVFEVIFPNLVNGEEYIDGTDNKIFRYLNALLKVTYMVSARINEIGSLLAELKEESLFVEEIICEEKWVNQLEDLYGMASEIRLIPNQTDINSEAKRLKVNEEKAKQEQQAIQQAPQPPAFNPQQAQPQVQQQPQQQTQQPQQQPQQPEQLSPEEIIRRKALNPYGQQPGLPQQPVYPPQQPMYGGMNQFPPQQPMYGGQNPGMSMPSGMQQQNLPSWMREELNNQSGQQVGMQQQPVMQQPMYPPQQPMYGGYGQGTTFGQYPPMPGGYNNNY